VTVPAGVGPGELRVTLNAGIRISGDLGALAGLLGALPGPAVAGGHGGARGQDFLAVEQAAEFLHVSQVKVCYLLCTRQLRGIKIGELRRISRDWIADFAGQQGPGGHGGRPVLHGPAARVLAGCGAWHGSPGAAEPRWPGWTGTCHAVLARGPCPSPPGRRPWRYGSAGWRGVPMT